MNKIIAKTGSALILLLLVGANCGSPCEKYHAKLTSLVADAQKTEKGQKNPFLGMMAKGLKEKKAQTIKDCKADMKQNPEKAKKEMDCALAAGSIGELMKCKRPAAKK